MSPKFPLAAKETPAVAAVEFAADGRTFVMLCRPEGFLATLNANSQAVVWDAASGKRLRVFDLEPDAAAIALGLGGRQLVSAGQPMKPEEAKEMADMGAKVQASTGVILWDVATGTQLRQYGGYDVSYETVQFSADGRYVLAGGSELVPMSETPSAETPSAGRRAGVLYVWDAIGGDEVLAIRPQQGVLKAAFSPSGEYVMTVSVADSIDVWNVKTQKAVLTTPAKAGVFSVDGKQLVTVSSTGLFEVFDVAEGKKLRSFNVCLNGVKCLALSADEKRLLVGMTHLTPPRAEQETADKQTCPRGEAVVVDLADGRVLGSLGERADGPGLVAVGPKGEQLLVGDGLWNTASGQRVAKLCSRPVEMLSAAFSPDGTKALVANHRAGGFLSGMFDGLFGQSEETLASLVETSSGKELAKFDVKQRVEGRVAVGFTPDGNRALLATRSGAISVWDVATAKKIGESQIACNNLAAAFSPDGKLAAVSFHETKTLWWDREKGERVAEQGREKGQASRPGTPPQATSDGKLQITLAEDGLGVVVQEVNDSSKSQTLKAELTPYEGIRAMGFDAKDERFVWAEISSPFAGIWDIEAGKKASEFSVDEPFSAEVMAFLPDGSRVVTAGDDGQVVLWDPATGKKVSGIQFDSPIAAIAPSADGKLVAVGCADRTAAVVSTASGEKTVMRGHEGAVDAVAFRPDGKILITASREDGTARLWNVADGKELARIVSVANSQDWLVFTPEGSYDGSEGGRKLAAFRIGDQLEVQPAEQFSAEFYQPKPGLLGKIWGGK